MKNTNKAIAIIPSRYASTRFPGKPLCDICGKTLIHRVWEAANQSKNLDHVIIATDDERIANECRKIGAEYQMTPSDLPSGSDRVYYTYEKSGLQADIIINLQGDEPLITSELLDYLVNSMRQSSASVSTLIKRITSSEELFDPSVVKVVKSLSNRALYFSRQAIPFTRGKEMKEWLSNNTYFKHIGIYAYTPKVLENFVKYPQSLLEKAESLEQLRLLDNDIPIHCFETDANLIGVDTPEDYAKVCDYFKIRQ